MDKKRVVLIKSNILEKDYRMPKEIEAMVHSGYSVTLLLWDQYCSSSDFKPIKNNVKKYKEIKLCFKSPFGIKKLIFLPIWWFFIFVQLMKIKWDIVHVINFDPIVPAIIVSKLKRKPVIYEVLEPWEDMIIVPTLLRSFFVEIDKIIMKFVNAVILADEAQIEEFSGIPNSKIVTIYDSPVISKQNSIIDRNKVFTLFYVGLLDFERRLNLEKIMAAVVSLENTALIIAGYGDMTDIIKKWSNDFPDKIQYIGQISYEESVERSMASDILFEIRDPIRYDYKYICGSKFLRGIACGKPFIASDGTSTGEKVKKENCGLVVDTNNINDIKNAIIKLRDNKSLCEIFGKNAKIAYEQKYSWEIMEPRLIDLYNNLIMA